MNSKDSQTNFIEEEIEILIKIDLNHLKTDSKTNISNKDYGKLVKTLEGNGSTVFSLASLNHGQLAAGTWDCAINIWDINEGKLIKKLTGHKSSVYDMLVLPNGNLASAGGDCTIKFWNLKDGTLIDTLEAH